MGQEDRMLTAVQVARRLGVSESTARRLIRSGVLPSRIISRRLVRVPESELRKLMETGKGKEEG